MDSPGVTFALALFAGVAAQSIGERLRIPGIVLLLLTGVLLGPDVAGWVRPATLGSGLEIMIGMSVAVILFEGGMNLRIGRLRREAVPIRRLITLGALVTALGATLSARHFMAWDWATATLFGTLVIVTGPTVITPLLKRVRVNAKVRTILEAEGVLIDPIGAIIAVVAFEVVITAESTSSAALSLLGIPARLAFGAVAGVAGGLLIAGALRRAFVPDGLLNVFTLALVITLYELCEAMLPESGIMAAPLAGMVVGNMRHRLKRELTEFKEQLTVMLVGLLFVLLVADVRLVELRELGWGGVFTVLTLMLFVRPLGVALSTAGSQLSTRERAFIAWLGPRGIVAAAVASLFASRLTEVGMEDGSSLRALVFLLIAVTVVVQGGLSPLVAQALGVRRPQNNGWLIIGANPLARLVARVLGRGGEEIVLIDTNAHETLLAERAGLRAVQGNAAEERTLRRTDVESRRGIIAVTPNEGINMLLSRRVTELFHVGQAIVALSRVGKVPEEQVIERGRAVLFGRPVDLQHWLHRLGRAAVTLETWRFEPTPGGGAAEPSERRSSSALLPIALERGSVIRPYTDRTRPLAGDRLIVARLGDKPDEGMDELRARGWTFEGELERLSAPRGERRAQPRREPLADR